MLLPRAGFGAQGGAWWYRPGTKSGVRVKKSVKQWARIVARSTSLRICYAMSRTDTQKCSISLRACYAMSGTAMPYSLSAYELAAQCPVLTYCMVCISLRIYYAMSGTDILYGGTRVLREWNTSEGLLVGPQPVLSYARSSLPTAVLLRGLYCIQCNIPRSTTGVSRSSTARVYHRRTSGGQTCTTPLWLTTKSASSWSAPEVTSPIPYCHVPISLLSRPLSLYCHVPYFPAVTSSISLWFDATSRPLSPYTHAMLRPLSPYAPAMSRPLSPYTLAMACLSARALQCAVLRRRMVHYYRCAMCGTEMPYGGYSGVRVGGGVSEK
eukprot:3934443-Rhodomonas_salina.1